ncbi:MAG TPA: DJ-1/PfpI family protein [Pyrinomonadaceae bacterium]|nr:DJ-1/PfpI family protein [Pyrinomonadaceae bacterium]
MRRREFFVAGSTAAAVMVTTNIIPKTSISLTAPSELSDVNKLTPSKDGPMNVAFAISRGATMIDFAGPWEVFQDVMLKPSKSEGSMRHPFNLYTVSETSAPIQASGGMKIVPDYTFETAPAPKVVVIPAQAGSPALHAWLRKNLDSTDVTMSVCTGAFQLGRAGLLSGKEATTHHDFFEQFAEAFPDVKLKRGLRFVEGPKISTAGGLTSGIDLALRVVERYFGRETAEQTAFYMEYQSKGWIV